MKKSVDIYIEKFIYTDLYKEYKKIKYNNYDIFCKDIETDVNETSLHPNFLSTIQLQINKYAKKSLNEIRFNTIFSEQKIFSTSSKNPPYVFHPIYSNVNSKNNSKNSSKNSSNISCYNDHVYHDQRFKIKKYENIFMYLNKEKIYDTNYYIPVWNIQNIISSLFNIHDKSFIYNMLNIIIEKKEINMFQLNLSSELISRFLIEINGSLLSSLLSLKYKMSIHIGGGNHHSKKGRGDGFCIFNDIAICIHFLLSNNIIKNVIVLDVDVHQGDGTAEIFHNVSNVKTVSIHCKDNYPHIKKKSYIDIELNSYIEDNEYLSIYENIFKIIKNILLPDTIIFYIAGVDISKDDDLGLLNISDEAIYKRDFLTYRMAIQNNIPIVTLLSGGYNQCQHVLTQKHILTFK
ncbi:histone deacetylase, putative, putative [Plasmodium gaboni]|uniref:Histone deacetylase, putative, putative n=1 Tax=Plasmodium gaboni TaxID=647221 RepID=A0ABY1UIF6_9APIC|nr:histone deacetylase, putative, putative [Plasmodium gaboni]